jgi:hypothetical protein
MNRSSLETLSPQRLALSTQSITVVLDDARNFCAAHITTHDERARDEWHIRLQRAVHKHNLLTNPPILYQRPGPKLQTLKIKLRQRALKNDSSYMHGLPPSGSSMPGVRGVVSHLSDEDLLVGIDLLVSQACLMHAAYIH